MVFAIILDMKYMRERNIIEKRQSIIRKLNKEQHALYIAVRQLGYVKLDKPIQHGWFKHLRLRDDISRRKDASIVEELLKACACDIWGVDKENCDRIWDHRTPTSKKRKRKRKRKWEFPGWNKMTKKVYQKLSDEAKSYYIQEFSHWDPWKGDVYYYRCKVPRYYFVTTYTKAYITEKKVMDGRLESRVKEIDNQLLSNELYSLQQHYKWDWDYIRPARSTLKRKLDQLKNMNLEEVAEASDFFHSSI